MVASAQDFTGNREDWERRVFLNAEHFRVHRFYGKGQHDHAKVKDFPEALRMCGREMRQGRRVLIYAVTAEGRFVALPQNQWLELYQTWMESHYETTPPDAANRPR